MKKITPVMVCLLALGLPVLQGGTKEEIIRLQSDVLQLQEQIRMLQKTLDERNGVITSLLEQLNDQVASTNATFQGLIQSVDALTAQGSETATGIGTLRNELQNVNVKIDDTNNRLAALHRKLEENQTQIQSLRQVAAEPGSAVEPDRVYSASFNDYLMGNYSLAVAGFQDFLANFPESEYADNAAYYLGDAYLLQDRPELAIQAFDQLINLYPKGDKIPVAYFKKAQALQKLQRIPEAVDTLKKLQRLFPKAPEATLAGEELTKLGVS